MSRLVQKVCDGIEKPNWPDWMIEALILYSGCAVGSYCNHDFQIKAHKAKLISRQQTLIAKYYGLFDSNKYTLKSLSNEYGVAPERIRELIHRGTRRARRELIVVSKGTSK